MAESFQEFMVNSLTTQVDLAGKSVLEIGADPWFLSGKAFRDRGAASVVCSDLLDVWHGATCDGITTAVFDAREAERHFPPASFDIIYGINILEHLPDIPVILDGLYKIAKPGGIVMLHGHPLWTSSRGHHAIAGTPGNWEVHFDGDRNPVPLWGHLTMTPEEMRAVLEAKGSPYIEKVLNWCYHSDLITRTPRRAIVRDIEASAFVVRHIWQDQQEAPDAQALERLKRRLCSLHTQK